MNWFTPKKWVTIIELVIYILIISTMWVIIWISMNKFLDVVNYNRTVKQFSEWYNDYLKDIYSYWYNWWVVTWNIHNWVDLSWDVYTWVLLNKNDKYLWYKCSNNGLWISYDYSLTWDIDWNNLNKDYRWFRCADIDYWYAWSGSWYFLDYDVMILDKKVDLKYYINN